MPARQPAPRLRPLLLAGLLLLLLAPARARAAHPVGPQLKEAESLARDTLAWVAGRAITASDLVQRIELMPWQEKQSAGAIDSAKAHALESLVGEALLDQEAERRGLGASGSLPAMRAALRRALSRDALYRRNVPDPAKQRDYMGSVLAGQRAAVDSSAFRIVADSLRAVMLRLRATPDSRGRLAIPSEAVDYLEATLRPRLARPMVRLAPAAIPLGDILEDLRFYRLAVTSLERTRFQLELNRQLKAVVEGELMAREALRQKLDQAPGVERDLAMWTSAWRAMLAGAALLREAPPEALDTVRWLALHEPALARRICEVDLQEVLCAGEAQAAQLRRELESGAAFDSVARAHSIRESWAARGGRSGFFPVREHERLGYAALLSILDSLVGPVPLTEGYSVFRVLGKRIPPDSAVSAEALAEAREGAAAERGSRALARSIAGLAARTPVRMDYSALRRVDILPQNMITRRLLGFGGEMLAAPTLPPLWEWATLWRSARPELP